MRSSIGIFRASLPAAAEDAEMRLAFLKIACMAMSANRLLDYRLVMRVVVIQHLRLRPQKHSEEVAGLIGVRQHIEFLDASTAPMPRCSTVHRSGA